MPDPEVTSTTASSPTPGPLPRPPDDQAGGPVPAASRTALKWSLVAQLFARAGQFGLGLVLARLLTPEEYGTYTIALGFFLILLTVDDLGLLKGLVRWPGRFEDAAPTVRLLGLFTGLAVYLMAFALAPLIADVTSTPAATGVIRVLCIGVILDAAFQIVPAAALQRAYRQDLWVLVELTRIVVLASVTIGLAATGMGVWSLVWGSLAGQCALSIVTTKLAKVPMEYRYGAAAARDLLRVSVPYSLAALVSGALLNVDYLVIGHQLGTVAVGIYLIAFNVSSWPTSLVGQAVRAVSIRSFAELNQRGEELGERARQALLLLFGGALPFVAVLIAMPELTIRSLYGSEWVSGAGALHFLALLSVVRLVDGLSDDLFFACGHAGWILAKNVVWLVLLVAGLSIGASMDGIRGVGIGHGVIAGGVILPVICVLLDRLGVWRRDLLVVAALMAVAAAFAGAVGWWVVHVLSAPNIVQLGVGGLVITGVYALLLLPLREKILAGGVANPVPAG